MKLAAAASVIPSRIRAVAALADQHPGTLRLFVGEDTLPTPDFIKAAAHRAIDENKTYYTPNAGYAEVRRAIADHLADLHGVTVDPLRQVVVTSSGTNAILLACQATVGPGDSALVLTPLWPNITAILHVAGVEPIEVPLEFSPSGYRLDFDRLAAALRPNTRLLAVASPGNPTGWMATADDWRRLVAFCARHNLWLLADGAYERIVYEGRVAPGPLTQPGAAERTILVQTFSKAYRMTGWRLGYAVAPPELGPVMANLQEFVVSNAPGIVQEAARAAIEGGEPFIAESQRRYARHFRLTVEHLQGIDGLELPIPSGAFYVFPRLAGLTDSVAFCHWLVRERRVGIAPGHAFGAGGEGHVRLCFAVDESTLREGLDRFAAGWRDYRETLRDG